MAGNERDREAVLIPTTRSPISYPALRSLGRRGVHVILASEFEHVPQFASRYCDETARVPSPREDLQGYADALLELAARPDVRTVLPTREADVYVLAKHRDAFEEHVSLVVPSLETLRQVHDRKRLFEAAADAGVPIPETRLLGDGHEWDRPHVVKSRYNLLVDEYVDSCPANETERVTSVKHCRPGESRDVDALRGEMRHTPIVQEFVPTADEYMIGALYDHGDPVAVFQHRQVRGDSYVGGGGVYRESVAIPELGDVARTLLDHLDWHGLACIEYMEDAETGEYKLTEINPRLWQSLPHTVRAGADFPYYYWLQATGRGDRIDPGYDVGVGSHLLYGELGYLASILRDDSPFVERPSLLGEAWSVLTSAVRQPQFDYVYVDDPGPFFAGVRHVLSSRS